MGVAYTDVPDDAPEELLRRADAAMYSAKDRGGNRVEVFDEELRRKVNLRLQHESEVRIALRRDEFLLHYQAEIDIETNQVVGAEALLRWNHPERGLLAASQFIDVVEETGSILEVGPWVLREACQQLREWTTNYSDIPLVVRVNLSARQINQPDLVPMVVQTIEDSSIDPSMLCLEITETTLMADPDLSLDVLQKLRNLGVELAVDDFGTGYSSLAYLKRFPVTVLKIDRSFVDGLGHDPDDTAIATAIVSLAKALGLGVTAEGVETNEQLEALRALGCRRVQGYLLARPEPADELAARLLLPRTTRSGHTR